MKALLIYPPVGNLKGPYLSVPALSAFLKTKGVDVTCVDLNILSFDRLLSPDFLTEAGQFCERRYQVLDSKDSLSAAEAAEYAIIAKLFPRWKFMAENINLIKACIRQETQDGTYGKFTAFEALLKEAIKFIFTPFSDSEEIFVEALLAPYYDSFVQHSSGDLVEWVLHGQSRFDRVYDEILAPYFLQDYDIIGISVSYDDQLAQAVKIAKRFKDTKKNSFLVLGGAYISSSCTNLQNPRLFDIVDALVVNDGEAPLWDLLRFRKNDLDITQVPNLIWRDNAGTVQHNQITTGVPLSELPPPDFSYIPFDTYLHERKQMLPLLLSHGCYWRKCAFCNSQLSLVADFNVQDVGKHIIPKIRHLIDAYGIHRFHFVDEAMPPKVLLRLSQTIIETGLGILWKGNIRAENFFTPLVCQLMAEAGCTDVYIGIESLNDETLKDMNKGTTVERVVRVVSNFADAGIHVNAYMIYGWPRETRKQLAGTLRMAKKLISERKISSFNWHPLNIGTNSAMFRNLSFYGIRNLKVNPAFDIQDCFDDFEVLDDPSLSYNSADFGKVRHFTDTLLERVEPRNNHRKEAAIQKVFRDQTELLDKAVIFPPHIVMYTGNYSLLEIKEDRLAKDFRQDKTFQRKARFRIMNLLTGGWFESSEDVGNIMHACKSASLRGASLGSVVNELAKQYEMDNKEIEQAVVSVLMQLTELGICLSEADSTAPK